MRGTSHINCSLRGLRGLRNVVTLKFTSKKGRPPSAFLLSSPLYQSPPLLQRLQPEEQNRGEEREKAVRGCCSLFGLIIHTAALALPLSLLIPPSFLRRSSLARSTRGLARSAAALGSHHNIQLCVGEEEEESARPVR